MNDVLDPFFGAISRRDVAAVEDMIRSGAGVNVTHRIYGTPLQYAVQHRAGVGMVRLLIDKGANVNARDMRMDTPLHMATYGCSLREAGIDVIRLLIATGADVNAQNINKMTPINNIISRTPGDRDDVLGLLIDNGANVNNIGYDNEPPIFDAVRFRFPRCTAALIDAGADVNHRNRMGITVLRQAVYVQNTAIVQILIGAGAGVVGDFDRYGFTLLSAASSRENVDIVRALLDADANIDERGRLSDEPFYGESVWTPLMQAARSDRRGVMELLIRRGADWTLTESGEGRNALQLTRNDGSRAFLEGLIRKQIEAKHLFSHRYRRLPGYILGKLPLSVMRKIEEAHKKL